MPETETETEGETETEKKQQAADVLTVLDRYKALHPRRKIVGDKPASVVRRALKNYTAAELIEAIEGNAGDEWHRSISKHGLDYVLRSPEIIDDFRARYAKQKTPQLIGVFRDPTPEELRKLGIPA